MGVRLIYGNADHGTVEPAERTKAKEMTVFITTTLMDDKNCQYNNVIVKNNIDNNFPWSVLLPTIEITSKCSKLYNETTCLRLVVPLEF